MRVLFVTVSGPGHYFPMVPLGWALRAAGHEVQVAAEPGFVDVITRSGLPAVAVGSDVDLFEFWGGVGVNAAAGSDPEQHRLERRTRAIRMFLRYAEAMADDLLEYARYWRPDLVVYETRAYAGVIAAASLHVPAIRHLWGLDSTFPFREFDEPFLADLFARYGVPEADPFGALTIEPCPKSMEVPTEVRRERMRYVPYNGPGSVPDWLQRPAGKPRICVTWGRTFALATGHLSPARFALEAASELPVEVVAAVHAEHRELLGVLPDNVRMVEYVPLSLLLPTCDVIVHQGGAGATMTAAAYGVRQVVVPGLADQFLNAERIAATGAARRTGAPPSAEELHEAVGAVVREPSFRLAAEALQAENQALPTPADLVSTLADMAREHWLAHPVPGMS